MADTDDDGLDDGLDDARRAAVVLVLRVKARGGLDALPPDDPLRRELALAVVRVAGLDQLPSLRERVRMPELRAYSAALLLVANDLNRLSRAANRRGATSVLGHPVAAAGS